MTVASGRLAAGVPRRLAALFGLAALGVLLALGLTVGRLGGPPALLAYLVAVAAALAVGLRRVRTAVRAEQRRAAVRRCACCSGGHTDPVRVV